MFHMMRYQTRALLLVLIAAAPLMAAHPKMVIEQRNLDLGEVVEGDVVDVKWKIHNEGDADLVIKDLRASCGCTVLDVTEEHKIVAPGATYTIPAQFHSQGRAGEQAKMVTVTSNDPSEPSAKLTFTAEVSRLYILKPASGVLHVRKVQRGERSSQQFELIPAEGAKDLDIESIDFSEDEDFVAEVESFDDPHGRFKGRRIKFRVKDSAPLGRLAGEGTIRVKAGDTVRERKLIVRGKIVGDVMVSPEILESTRIEVRKRQQLPGIQVLGSTPDTEFRILTVDGGPLLNVAYKETTAIGNLKGFVLRPIIRDDAPVGPFGTIITVKTTSEDRPTIRIPVFANIASPVDMQPDAALFHASSANVGQTIRVRLTADHGQELVIGDVHSDHDAVAVRRANAKGKPVASVKFLQIELKQALPEGVQNAVITVHTNIKDAETLTLPVTLIGV